MAREANIQAVRDGIHKAFALTIDEPPTGTAIAAAAGVSLSTVNRVLRDHEQVRETLALAQVSFHSGRGRRIAGHTNNPTDDGADPVTSNPKLVVRKLEQVIAGLLAANEAVRRDNSSLRIQVEELRDRLRQKVAYLPDQQDAVTDSASPEAKAPETAPRHISEYPAALRRARSRRRY